MNDAFNHFSEDDVTSSNSGTHLQKLAREIRTSPNSGEPLKIQIAKKMDQFLKER
jgi:hypothetical protein